MFIHEPEFELQTFLKASHVQADKLSKSMFFCNLSMQSNFVLTKIK